MKFNRFASALVGLALGALFSLPSYAQVLSQWPQPNFNNLLDNPEFDIYQRGTTAVTGINTTATYHADRWAAYANNGSASVSLTNVTAGLPVSNFTNAEQVQRASGNANTTQICLAQEIPTSDTTAIAGQPVTVSFWAQAGANFSAASSNLTVKLTTGTGSDEGLATLITGFTGAATPINYAQAITTSWQRYAVTGTVASTATEAAVQLCWTPVGTAGTSDYFQVTGVQLVQGTSLTPYERRPYAVELTKVQRYYYTIKEAAAGVVQTPVGSAQGTTTTCTTFIPFPNTMRVAPTYTNALSAATFKIVSASQTATALGTPYSATLTANTVNGASINFTTTGMTAKDSCFLVGAGGAGVLAWTADF